MILKFCTEHGSITAVLCANFQNDFTTKMDVMDEQEFTRFLLFLCDVLSCNSSHAAGCEWLSLCGLMKDRHPHLVLNDHIYIDHRSCVFM